ncbi:alpha/beta hydrolase [Zhouia amylolytica]|uniref:alpha/beta hydrolase n=1 Tax=Zhouia amylolytica TaxID=376730 RepID=UPI0020CE4A06|nr:alpha/beta hydrolase [Zhouia amylolytica]MCQ0110962.1 alpha/beta hydrolase [Zhouia amylolytica]
MRSSFFIFSLYAIIFGTCLLNAQERGMPIWGDPIPNKIATNEEELVERRPDRWIEKVQVPTVEVFLPENTYDATDAVVICPGGGYKGVAYDLEGTKVAKWLQKRGVAAFVLKYRLPTSKSVKENEKVAIQDLQRTVRMVRANAKKWNINENGVGVIGFSAGGHLTATLAVHHDTNFYEPQDATDTQSAKPNFVALIYPVITMQSSFKHAGSVRNLLGESPGKLTIDFYSPELQVTKDTPPSFIVHASDDKAVPVENSLVFYESLLAKEVLAEMHIYPKGGHGFGLAQKNPHLSTWIERFYEWIQTQ